MTPIKDLWLLKIQLTLTGLTTEIASIKKTPMELLLALSGKDEAASSWTYTVLAGDFVDSGPDSAIGRPVTTDPDA